jgi:integrase
LTLINDTADWHGRRLSAILPTEIQRLLEQVCNGDAERKARPYWANKMHARLKHFFTWCCDPGIKKLSVSPMTGIKRPFKEEKRRERKWFEGDPGDEAIRAIWAAADKLGGVEGQYLKVLLLTGKRKTALSEMKWDDISDTWFWKPPPGRKNKRCDPVPLSSLVQRMLRPRQPDGGPVFPGRRVGEPIDVRFNLSKRAIAAGAPAGFFLHGVRHIAETKLAELGVPDQIRDLLFDHVGKRGSGGIYDHSKYRKEMTAAVELWASHIEKLVSPAGAVRLR